MEVDNLSQSWAWGTVHCYWPERPATPREKFSAPDGRSTREQAEVYIVRVKDGHKFFPSHQSMSALSPLLESRSDMHWHACSAFQGSLEHHHLQCTVFGDASFLSHHSVEPEVGCMNKVRWGFQTRRACGAANKQPDTRQQLPADSLTPLEAPAGPAKSDKADQARGSQVVPK